MGDPECPGSDCMMCSGEACNLCGAGCWNNRAVNCEHDTEERHRAPDLNFYVISSPSVADIPAGIHDLTDEQWSALADAMAGNQLPPERRDLLTGGAGQPRLLTETWCGGTRPSRQHVTVLGRAYLDAAAALWAGLTESERLSLRNIANMPGHVTWDAMAYHLQERRLVGYGVPRVHGSRPGVTPLGRAVARAGGAR